MAANIEVTTNECRYIWDLRTADILLTKSNSGTSKIIQAGTCAPVSHAIVMISPVRAIEAEPLGVRESSIDKVLELNDRVMLLRHRTLSLEQSLKVSQFLRQQVGKPYDKIGAARSAASTGCSYSKYTSLGLLLSLVDEAGKLNASGHDRSFYCSELVARAFDYSGAPLTRHKPKHVSPGALLRSEMLQIVRILK